MGDGGGGSGPGDPGSGASGPNDYVDWYGTGLSGGSSPSDYYQATYAAAMQQAIDKQNAIAAAKALRDQQRGKMLQGLAPPAGGITGGVGTMPGGVGGGAGGMPMPGRPMGQAALQPFLQQQGQGGMMGGVGGMPTRPTFAPQGQMARPGSIASQIRGRRMSRGY